jgi:hypothetical protein
MASLEVLDLVVCLPTAHAQALHSPLSDAAADLVERNSPQLVMALVQMNSNQTRP